VVWATIRRVVGIAVRWFLVGLAAQIFWKSGIKRLKRLQMDAAARRRHLKGQGVLGQWFPWPVRWPCLSR